MKFILPFILCIGSISCGEHFKKAATYNYPYQPREDQYKLSKKSFIFIPVIDTNSVYLKKEHSLNNDFTVTTTYSFMRFSNRGFVFVSDDYPNLPNNDQINTMESGQFCRYKITGNKIKIEAYNHRTRGFDFWLGTIKDSVIGFTKYKSIQWWKYKGVLKHQMFIKHQAAFLKPLKFPE